jgi:hypothetical protein
MNGQGIPTIHQDSPMVSDDEQVHASVRGFVVGLLLVAVVLTPALIALSPYSESPILVALTSPFIVAFMAMFSAAGCYLYERYGAKRARFSWSSAFLTFALPGTILNVLGFASVVRLMPAAESTSSTPASVFMAILAFSFVMNFFMFFAIVIIKPTVLDSRKRVAILIIMFTLFIGPAFGQPRYLQVPAAMAGITLGLWAARFMGKRIGPMLLVLRSLWPYIKAMMAPTATFILGYLMIAFIFAGFMGALYRVDPASFNGVRGDQPSFFVFFYYTLVTMTTVGYGDIAPASTFARILSSSAALVSLCWVTVVFAAVIAFLQPRFARILSQATEDV